jgi:MATE family multidrug resistance protein
MLVASALFLSFPQHIAHLFTPDPGVIAAAVPLLLIAAGFQFFDGIQINATGALRGAGNTTAPFFTQLVCYEKLGAAGLWWGLLIALTAAAFVLVHFWHKTSQSLHS